MSPNRLPGGAAPAALDFEPVPLRYRRDGWTPARQGAFIAALRGTGCILAACREVGISAAAAYKLYRHPGAASFRGAWHAAFGESAWTPPPPSAGPITSAGPSTSAPRAQVRAPFAAVALWPMPNATAQRGPSQASTFSTSSTSAETHGSCRARRTHQLPDSRELPAFAEASAGKPEAATPERPAYSLEAFARIVRSAGLAPPK